MARIAGIVTLIAVLLIQTLSTSIIFTSFELNRATITELFCINKDKPEMHCNGNCFLEKQIKADKKSHENSHKTAPDFISLVYTLMENNEAAIVSYFTEVKHHFTYILHPYSQFESVIFHPPKF